MLSDKRPLATLAVKDMAVARKFYEEKLGLKPISTQGEHAVTYQAGGAALNVYRSSFAGTNQATAVTWMVGDALETEVQARRAKDVRFERYDLPNVKLDGDIYTTGNVKIAWFKDPDGNIMSLVNG
jgi:catechol 2,3-dioxygenase-like lactoylglutathione lyase family enzyme